MKRLLSILMVLVAFAAVGQQKQISGTVTGADGEPLSGVTVKVFSGHRLRTFARTNSSGKYLLKVPEGDSLTMRFERMSYAKVECPVPAVSPFDVKMTVAPTEIREVVVNAPSVKMRGDTLSFNVAAFIGKGDVSLEDALKKIPGITVASNGAIKYLGRDISNFYVEGLDMLGGRYTLATRSLPAEYVSSVEVLSNHKKRKMDAAKHSDDVALNVKLKASAKIRPVGTYEGSLGYGDKRALYRISGTAMLFRPKLQTLVSVKGGNVESFAGADMIVHYGDLSGKSKAAEILPEIGAGGAPVARSRYENVRDWLVSANTIIKTAKDATLRVNASYTDSHDNFSYSTTTNYFTGGEALSIEEIVTPSSSASKPSLEVDYTQNSDNKYVTNVLKASGDISHQELAVINNGVPLEQKRRFRSVSINDYFRYSIKIGAKEWDFESRLNFNNSPLTRLSISGGEDYSEHLSNQSVKSSTFVFSQQAYASWHKGRSTVYLPLNLKYEYDDIFTGLHRNGGVETNRLYANIGGIGASPSYNYEIPGNKFSLRLGMPVAFNIIRGDNKATGDKMEVDRVTVSPYISMFYKLNGNNEFTFNSSYDSKIGDILSLLGNPVQTSFRNFTARSGVMAKSNGWRGNIGYKFQRPFDYWFLRSNISYSSTRRNTIGSSYITEGETYQTDILSPNTTDIADISLSLSKTFPAIHTKIDLNASGSWSRRETIQQDIAVRYYGRSVSTGIAVDCTPARWMNLRWTPNVSHFISSYLGSSSSYTDFGEYLTMSFFPGGGVELRGMLEHVRKPIGNGVYKNMALLDVKVVWKHGKWRWNLALDNILDRKNYRYTVFSGLDTRHLDYKLKGRTLVASVSFTL
ncbi:MAG: carboxypeptidase regulatory-like domain-containing protein [Paramuribaculum sp.]|nr:carboxypeptidase regulatory-like domain-containing protein [Paramuribaculum sp.]